MHQRGSPGGAGLMAPPEDLFAPANIGNGITMEERTRPDDSYRGSQQLGAAFLMLDWQVFPWARIAGGVRVEAFRQTVASFSPFAMAGVAPPDETVQSNVDPLPAAALVVTLTPEMQLRFNYGHSVARPQARELAPFQYPDFIRRRIIIGNASLQRSLIHSADVRWEWFPGATEVIAVTGFAKQFDRPIESVTYGVNSTYTFDNAQGAQLWGGEIEGRLSLGRIAPELAMLTVGANLTLVWSQVTLTPEQQDLATSRVRPLAGQSPWVVNASIGFEPPGTGLHIGLFYTVFGPRIVDVGRLGLPDVYQLPLHQLDLTALWDVTSEVQLRANVTNMFYDDYVLQQGDQPILQYNPGLNAQIGVTVTTQ
jgi:outer membrane receptor protein involved in Fe transport